MKAISLGILTWDSLDNCNSLSSTKLKVREAVISLCQKFQGLNVRDGQKVPGSLDDLLQPQSRSVAYDKNEDSSKLLGTEPLQPQQRWTWLANVSATAVNGYPHPSDDPDDQRLHQGTLYWWQWTKGGIVGVTMTVFPQDGHLVVLLSALQLCLEWLGRSDKFDDFTSALNAHSRPLAP